jgi:RimJ/RimL family protein N-acetyltransferase
MMLITDIGYWGREFVELMGIRVSIRPVTWDDLPTVCKWWNDPVVMKEVHAERFKPTLEQVQDIFRQVWRDPGPTQFHMFMICLADRIIGEIGYASQDLNQGKVSVDYKIGETALWGHGLATEALKLLISYLFEKTDTKQITAQPGDWNVRSLRLLEKCGFTEIGREWSPANDYFDGGFGINMVLDRDEYYSSSKNKGY